MYGFNPRSLPGDTTLPQSLAGKDMLISPRAGNFPVNRNQYSESCYPATMLEGLGTSVLDATRTDFLFCGANIYTFAINNDVTKLIFSRFILRLVVLKVSYMYVTGHYQLFLQ